MHSKRKFSANSLLFLCQTTRDDEQNLPASSTGHTRIPETSQEPATLVSAVEQTQGKETKLQSGLFDASRLDRKEFDNLIRELLSSRSHESGKQQPADGTSSPFLIIGWFAKGSTDPNERLITLEDDENLFKQIRKRVKFIRGWREYISLKSLCRFGLYKVHFLFPLFQLPDSFFA